MNKKKRLLAIAYQLSTYFIWIKLFVFYQNFNCHWNHSTKYKNESRLFYKNWIRIIKNNEMNTNNKSDKYQNIL
jgi:hypothetical protein